MKKKGFAALPPPDRREAARRGGKSAAVRGTLHELTAEDRRRATAGLKKTFRERPAGGRFYGAAHWQRRDPSARALRGQVHASRLRAERACRAVKDFEAQSA